MARRSCDVPVPEKGEIVANVSQEEVRRLTDRFRDPAVTDGDKYKVIMENERVRVLEYRDSPGQRTSPHFHPDYVL